MLVSNILKSILKNTTIYEFFLVVLRRSTKLKNGNFFDGSLVHFYQSYATSTSFFLYQKPGNDNHDNFTCADFYVHSY